MFWQECRKTVVMFILMTVLLGGVYPLAMVGVGKWVFPWQAQGSLLTQQGKVIGSALIGQSFNGPQYFHSRPSASDYNPMASGGSNLSQTSKQLITSIEQRVKQAQHQDGHLHQPVPVDLVTASGSGLDPDISVAAAQYQAQRVAKARHLPLAIVEKVIQQATVPAQFGVLGQASVNVVKLNQSLSKGKLSDNIN